LSTAASDGWFTQEIEAARGGDLDALGRILDSCRKPLQEIAGRWLGKDLVSKTGDSEVVQEALLGAHLDFARFEGRSREELFAWLRAILQYRLAYVARQYRDTEMRRVDRELPCGAPADGGLWDTLLDGSTTPGVRAARRESEAALRRALETLPDDYRCTVIWHQYDGLGFEEIGARLGRSAEATRKLWSRSLLRLAMELGPGHAP
jgi:RNA polymerase sigma-70 factor (ECF subfamily)